MSESTQKPPVGDARAARLFQIGPDGGNTFYVPARGAVVGRDAAADVRIEAPDLSRRHLRLSRDEEGWLVADLDSRNGTLLDGEHVSQQARRLPLGSRLQLGTVTLLFTAHDDIGEKLVELQKMEALGRMAAGVAHDFRNLLSAMNNNVQFALDSLGETVGVEPDVLESLAETTQALQRASELTAQLLSIVRSSDLEETQVDLSELIEEVDALTRRQPNAVHVIVEAEPHLMVRGDRTRLHQLLMNLAVNGCDAMPEGGTLTLRARPYRGPAALLANTGSSVSLEVIDTGVGIDPTIRTRIFEPFFSTKGSDGTGLGLATVYSVVRHHGGEISVESSPRRGSLFRVVLPTGEQERAREETVSRTPSIETLFVGKAVMLVDDEPMVLAASQRLLESWGYAVYTAEGGADAVQLFEEVRGELSCVIVDVQMPGLDGLALLRILRMVAPDLRAIVTSARVDPEYVRDDLGPNDLFVPKPHDKHLRRALRELVG
jgi:two-component system cell cycle sensor histidine kinase/response regulator CckA